LEEEEEDEEKRKFFTSFFGDVNQYPSFVGGYSLYYISKAQTTSKKRKKLAMVKCQ